MSEPKKGCYVGFDTSNYTTSAAVCDNDGKVILNLKRLLPVKEGELGLRQSEAVFAHVKNLPQMCGELGRIMKEYTLLGVGVSEAPRQQEGSYMPCFLCGVAFANAFAASRGFDVFKTTHQNGHIMAALYSSGAAEKLMKNKFLAFHLSGGTSEALLVTPDKNSFDIRLVGGTRDISAGQAIDRAGVMMGLSFPAGRELEVLAAEYLKSNKGIPKEDIKKLSVNDGFCNISGLENHAKKLYETTNDKGRTAAFVFDFLCRTVAEMTKELLGIYGDMPVLFSGGVMSNKLMREELSKNCEAYFAEPEFSADNAAGVALLCRNALKEK